MFWSRTGREARRQKVLDELLEVAPEDRVSRLQEAVTAGDVRANEVEQALRLVDRLDGLRVMTIPHVDGGFRAAHATDLETVARVDDLAPEAAASEASEISSPAGGVLKARERRVRARKGSKAKEGTAGRARHMASRVRTAVPVVREPEAVPIAAELGPDALAQPESPVAVDPQILAEPMPIDAVEAAARLIARDLAARKAARGYPVPRRRRRIGDEVQASQEPSMSVASGDTADPAGPSIDWLRP